MTVSLIVEVSGSLVYGVERVGPWTDLDEAERWAQAHDKPPGFTTSVLEVRSPDEWEAGRP